MNSTIFKRDDRLWFFFIAVFIITWVIWIPIVILQDVEALQSIIGVMITLGVMIPSLGGIVFTYLFYGSDETKELLKRGIKGFKIIWFIILIVLSPILAIIAIGLTAVFTSSMNLVTDIPQGFIRFIVFPLMLLIGGPLFEEFGWRGFALDRLQSKWNGLVSSILLGIIWGVWHVPLFFIVGTSQNIFLEYLPLWVGLFFIEVIFISIIMTWLYNNTERSILGSILFHTMFNTTWIGFFFAILTGFVEDPATLATNTEVINILNLGNIILTILMFCVCIIITTKWGLNLGKAQEN